MECFIIILERLSKKINISTVGRGSDRKTLLIFMSLVILLVSVSYYKYVGTNMNLSALQFPLLPIDLLNAVCLVVTLYFIAEFLIMKRWCKYMIQFFTWFGENSMVVYFIHCIEYHFTIPFLSHFVGKSVGPNEVYVGYRQFCNPDIDMCDRIINV